LLLIAEFVFDLWSTKTCSNSYAGGETEC